MHSLARDTNAWACYDCGKCTAICPLSRAGADYSPRRHVLATNLGTTTQIISNGSLSKCLTCGLCDTRCPADVSYTELVLRLREHAHDANIEPECPHGGALQSIMRMMAAGGTQQDRLGWLTDDLHTDPHSGSIFLWTGCTVYYDAFFPELGMHSVDGTRAAVRVLNHLGETPVVSPEERCCGHDLLWNGNRSTFAKLAQHNLELVRASGADTVVAPCAECARTWRLDYPALADGPMPRVLHLTEYLAERHEELQTLNETSQRVTFQDPCRLGRHLGDIASPRTVLTSLPGVELHEMAKSGRNATCCAGGTWTSCDRFAKQIQVDRLRQARATGADVLVTACPKCQVHFACAMKDPNLGSEITIEMRDLAEIVAATLQPSAET